MILLSDDQRWDTMGCAGNSIIRTPNLDALARDGVRFRNMFVTTAICAASRASIFTGLYERTHRYTFGTPPLADHLVAMCYPAVLKRAGYRTGFVGKFGVAVGPDSIQKMFDHFVPLDRDPYFKRQPDGTQRHLTDLEADHAIAFLDSSKADEPFCLSVSFNAPHAEDNDPQQYYWAHACDGLYADAVIPVPKTMTDDFFNAQPAFLRESESRVRFLWRFNEPAKYQEMVKGYYRMISGVDLAVGRIRSELARRGLADNTIVVFTSDNGYFLGERGFADKWYIYEPSIRVPLLIYDPRAVPARRGRQIDPMALNVDLAPTILDLAGVAPMQPMQGRSLVPLLGGEPPPDWRTDFFYEHLFQRKNIAKSEGVRTQRWTYVRWFEQTPFVEELYDHQLDFDQKLNLVGTPEFAGVVAQLRQRTTELRDQYASAACALKDKAKPAARTRVAIVDGKWHINEKVTYAGTKAEGLLMNVRMVNATFEDRSRKGFDAEANTTAFIKRIPDYAAHGVRAFTLCLQGGTPGYEGALNSAFNPDGSLRDDYLKRVDRVIEACDQHGIVVILGCFYQRQSAVLRDEQAVRAGLINVVEWIRDSGRHNVVLETANEYPHGGFVHNILRCAAGEAELLRLAKKTWSPLLVSASGYGDGKVHDEVAEASDFLLIHFNGTPVDQIPARIAKLRRFGKPIVCNEDDKTGETAARAAEVCVDNRASWGLMLKEINQYQPFRFGGAADDRVVYAKLKQLTTSR